MEITNAVVPSMLSEEPSTKKVKISRDSATKNARHFVNRKPSKLKGITQCLNFINGVVGHQNCLLFKSTGGLDADSDIEFEDGDHN